KGLHPGYTAFKIIVHGLRVVLVAVAVTRQHPLKFVIQKFFHRARLLGPRVPGDAAKSSERLSLRRPREVIASEEKLVAVKIDDVTARVSRRRNDQQIVVKLHLLFASDHV